MDEIAHHGRILCHYGNYSAIKASDRKVCIYFIYLLFPLSLKVETFLSEVSVFEILAAKVGTFFALFRFHEIGILCTY